MPKRPDPAFSRVTLLTLIDKIERPGRISSFIGRTAHQALGWRCEIVGRDGRSAGRYVWINPENGAMHNTLPDINGPRVKKRVLTALKAKLEEGHGQAD